MEEFIKRCPAHVFDVRADSGLTPMLIASEKGHGDIVALLAQTTVSVLLWHEKCNLYPLMVCACFHRALLNIFIVFIVNFSCGVCIENNCM